MQTLIEGRVGSELVPGDQDMLCLVACRAGQAAAGTGSEKG